MRKLVNGIIEFRKKQRPNFQETFAKLALGQAPDALFIACSDSRVVPNLFASTDPGDLFVIRNVGNMVPRCGHGGTSTSDVSEAAALEFALLSLPVTDIIICGHSQCGAMHAVTRQDRASGAPNLNLWLRHAGAAYERVRSGEVLDSTLSLPNQVSQVNVLQQLEHVRSYPVVQERLANQKLRLHGWWFDIAKADVYTYDEHVRRFVLIDEDLARHLLPKLER